MKYLTLISTLLTTFSLHALPIGNPSAPQITFQGLFLEDDAFAGAKLGYEKRVISNRELFIKAPLNVTLSEASLMKDLGTLTLNYLDRLEIHGSLGSVQGKLAYLLPLSFDQEVYVLKQGYLAGCGGKLLLSQWGNCVLGMDGKVEWLYPHVSSVISKSQDLLSLHAFEWQTALAVSYTTEWLTPYIGTKYSSFKATLESHGIDSPLHLRSSHRWGMSIGFTLSPGTLFDVSFESQLIDEEGWMVGGNLRF
ncbi:MAG: hypothetical protein QRY72_04600 [Candidatus Rhabdochlamydia sp.]